ncbi:hypothetical protein TWF718_002887 [Orbilia javanica]|uniref:Uncharacterized protein n=1 Tax=Orbilia javanica TaxID=47235 RepID=A0AAN8MF64_9PEZI
MEGVCNRQPQEWNKTEPEQLKPLRSGKKTREDGRTMFRRRLKIEEEEEEKEQDEGGEVLNIKVPAVEKPGGGNGSIQEKEAESKATSEPYDTFLTFFNL